MHHFLEDVLHIDNKNNLGYFESMQRIDLYHLSELFNFSNIIEGEIKGGKSLLL